jgi:D-glycero-beta-D-manno-heptose-7-phosphate kinase
MIEFNLSRFKQLKESFKGKNIVVIGDMMLDCYLWGEVRRISPEAPVPVIEIGNEFYRFGGAANVALNILKLDGNPMPIGIIGNDNDGKIFSSLLKEMNINGDGIIIDESRPTTAKTRVIAHDQHVVRIDRESKEYLNEKVYGKLFNYLTNIADKVDGIILQDYNKGVLSPHLIEKVINLAKVKDILITVDPKFNNFFKYKNVTVFKPNRKEAEDVLGIKIRTDEDVKFACKKMLEQLDAKYILLTLGEEGIAVFEKGKDEKRMSTQARKVADVSGAGDTVISTLTMALSAGANIYESSYLANYAAGIVCEEVGIVPIELEKLFNKVFHENLIS